MQDLFLALFFLANELATLFGVLLFNDIVFTLKYFIYKISNVLFHTFYFFTVTSCRRFYQSHSDSTVTPWQQSRWSIIYNLCTSSCPEVSCVEMLHNRVFFTLGGLCTSWVLVTSLNETAMRNKVHLAQPMLVDNIIADIYACAGALCANYCVLMSQFLYSLPADRKNKTLGLFLFWVVALCCVFVIFQGQTCLSLKLFFFG